MNRVIDRYSVVFVAIAATLWATDAYFRNQLVKHLTPSEIVVMEDALVALFLLPVLIRSLGEVRKLGARGWLAVVAIAAGAQALATILFTKSFSYGIYSETFVLQQTQPLIAIVLAWIMLGERRRPWFWAAVVVALIGVYMVVQAPNISLGQPLAPIASLKGGRLDAGLYALGAAAPPPWGFQQQIFPAQIAGTVLLLGVIVFLGWTKEKKPPVLQAKTVELTAG